MQGGFRWRTSSIDVLRGLPSAPVKRVREALLRYAHAAETAARRGVSGAAAAAAPAGPLTTGEARHVASISTDSIGMPSVPDCGARCGAGHAADGAVSRRLRSDRRVFGEGRGRKHALALGQGWC